MLKILKTVLLLILFFSAESIAQNETWFYLVANDTLINPTFKKQKNVLVYTGNDMTLSFILDKYILYDFKKTYRNASKENLKKSFFVRVNSEGLLQDLLDEAGHLFKSGLLIPEEQKRIFEPNDYGLTSTIGANIGAQVNLDYLDFLGLPKAWYYTTGSREVAIGISDGGVDSTLAEFKGKTKVYQKSPFVRAHGYSTGANAAAQGNNGYGIVGVCYDCSLNYTSYAQFKRLGQLIELSEANTKVINCSWVGSEYYETAQQAVYKMFDNGALIVASAGNKDWNKGNKGEQVFYPASYDKVISVSSAMYKYKTPQDNILYEKSGKPYVHNIEGYIGRTAGFKDGDVNNPLHIYHISVATLNKHVDILTPTVGLFSYGKFATKDTLWYSPSETTSGAAPLVSGTIGLMYSLYTCLPIDEVESILKITSMNIDHIEANKVYAGNYGAGILQTGDAVEMVYQLYAKKETAYIQNQHFSRWDFKITSLSKEIRLQNQKFTDSATLKVSAKNKIVIGENTILKPDKNGSISLKIDPNLERQCELVLRDPSIEE